MRRFVALALVAVSSMSVWAAAPADPRVGAVYLGYVRGDALLDVENSPELDDDFSVGIEWGYLFSEHWGALGRLGYSPNQLTNLVGNDVGADLLFVDFSGTYQLNFDNLTLYAPFGVGYAKASFDREIRSPGCSDTSAPGCFAVGDDGGLTFHVGIGMSFPISKKMVIRTEGRYRILTGIADKLDDAMDTFELNVGLGWTY